MKIDFSKVIFMNKSQVTFHGPDKWVKGWILSNSDMSVVKRRLQGDNSMIPYLPTPPLEQDMTHGQFLSGV